MKVELASAILVVALTASAFPANAETIYSDVGNPYTTIAVPSSGYTTADRIISTLTLAKPLTPNQTLAWEAGGKGTLALAALGLAVVLTTTLPSLAAQAESDLVAFRSALLQAPEDVSLLRRFLDEVERMHRYSEGINIIREVMAAHGNSPILYHTLASMEREAGDDQAAAQDWRNALRLLPHMESAAYELARLQLRQQHLDAAMATLVGFLNASDKHTSPVRVETLQLLIDVVDEGARATAELRLPVDELNRKALARLSGEVAVVVSRVKEVTFFPDRERYLAVKVPPMKGSLTGKQFAEVIGSACLSSQLYGEYGILAEGQGRIADASFYFTESYNVVSRTNFPTQYTAAAGNLAHFDELTGRYDEARSLYDNIVGFGEEQLKTSAHPRVKLFLANNYLNAAEMAWNLGELAESLRLLYRAEQLYGTDSPHPGSELWMRIQVLSTIALHYLGVNDVDQADREIDKALKLASSPDALLTVDEHLGIFLVKGEIAFQRGDVAGARSAIERAQSAVSKRTPVTEKLELGLLQLKLLASDPSSQVEFRRCAMELMKATSEEEKRSGTTLGYLRVETILLVARKLLEQQMPDDRIEQLLETVSSHTLASDPYNWRVDLLQLKARYYEQKGDDERAEQCYRENFAHLQQLRENFPVADNLFTAEQRLAEAYRSHVRFLLRQRRFLEALGVLESSRAETMVRALQLRLASPFQDADGTSAAFTDLQRLAWQRFALTKAASNQVQASELSATLTRELDHVSADYRRVYLQVAGRLHLPSQTSSIEDLLAGVKPVQGYVVVFLISPEDQRLTSWWIWQGELVGTDVQTINWPSLNADFLGVSQAVAYGDGSINSQGGQKALVDVTNQLADLLLPPSRIPRGTRLTVIPDPAMQQLSFAGLTRNGEPLIAEQLASLTYAPGLRVLAWLQSRYPAQSARTALFIGFEEAPGYGMGALEYARDDASWMAKQYRLQGGQADELVDSASLTPEKFRAAFQNQGLVVVGTHGYLDAGNSLNGFLLLPSGERIHAFDLFGFALQGSRVVLSSCELGADAAYENADLLGMTLPVFAGGARSVVHAGWSVDQRATSEIIRSMVLTLSRSGSDVSVALAQAQRQYWLTATIRTKHPKFWAAWKVIGIE